MYLPHRNSDMDTLELWQNTVAITPNVPVKVWFFSYTVD